jgi:hypothetical protein
MWVIYKDPKNVFVDLDKYTYMLVRDEDILEYQTHLAGRQGYIHEIQTQNKFLQQFVSFYDQNIVFFARRYEVWGSKTNL